MTLVTVSQTHTGPTGQPRYRVVLEHGNFVQGFGDLSEAEKDATVAELHAAWARKEQI